MNRFYRVALLLAIIAVLGVPVPSFPWPLPDTGQTKCYNDTGEINCPQPGEVFYGQDGSYLINPPSYTKLDADSNDLPDSATSWIMVRDNVTGLIWEVKTDDGSIHDKNDSYTWNDAQNVFIAALNNTEFGGHLDWRIPTIEELTSIVDEDRFDPAINTAYFPNTMSTAYWSSTTYAYYTNFAWDVHFYYGAGYLYSKSSNGCVRAVRGGQSRSLDHLVTNGDGTVTDTSLGLMWQQATQDRKTWQQALSDCESLSLADYTDWRLPTIKELRSIVDRGRYSPAINTAYFPNTVSTAYFSSTTIAEYNGFAWLVNFVDGGDNWYEKPGHLYVRAVRGGQNRLFGHLFILTPQQGSAWKVGDPMAISWETQGIAGNVKISISREGGKAGTFETIEEDTENDGAYNWTVSGLVSVNCVLKIEPIDDNSKGTTQGLFTIYGAPTASTGPASSLSSESATLNGTVNPNFACTTVIFEWGTDTNYGNEVSATQSPLTGGTEQDVSAELTGLSPQKTYHCRVRATNSAGTAYGEDQVFTTNAVAPTVTTAPVISIGANTAESGGDVTSDGGDLDTTRGVCWSTSENPTIVDTKTTDGSGTGPFTSNITGLISGTTYHVRAYATNSVGTGYGLDIAFTTLFAASGSLTVTFAPAETLGAGAKWKVDAGEWQGSGATVSNLAEGDYTVYFKDVDGWIPPQMKPVNIVGNQTIEMLAVYQQETGRLPDTGQTKCYNNTTEIPCPLPGEDFYGQDGNYLINAPSYTKLDENGNDLADTATEWVMVRDNVTGLIWEVKTDDGSIHDKDTWYTWQDAKDVFVASLNSTGFGGYSDWRLPTMKELAFIVNYGRSNPTIDTTYFPNTFWSMQSPYWSSTTSTGITSFAWTVSFYRGEGGSSSKSSACYVRAVRGGQSENCFVDNGDGTVTGTSTGLMWQKATAPGTYWEVALLYCEGLTLAGYTDWRLPSIQELRSIVDYDRYGPAIDTAYFPDTLSSSYWSSTPKAASFPDHAWYIGFGSGYDFFNHKSYSYYVRAVRAGQNQVLGHLVILTPAQGSAWKVGNPMSISWEPQGIAGNVQLSISREGGKEGTFEIIEESTDNDGTYNWTVTGPVSVNCVLKIEPPADLSKGTTQGLFTIYGAPTASTGPASSLSSESATLNGTVNPNFACTTVIFEWGTDTNYGNEVSATQSPLTGGTDQEVSAELTGLSPETTYHCRVKATNSAGTSYGDDQPFVTSTSPVTAPVVTTGSASSVTSTSATLNGTVNPNSADTTYHFEYGTSTSYGSSTTSENAGSGNSDLSVSAQIAGLSPNTTYNYRLVATNSGGTSYGSDQTFTTTSSGLAPTATTGSATSVTSDSATLNGTVNPQGLESSYYFQYGTSASYGSTTLSTSAGPGTSDITVSESITGLLPDTIYHYRLVATNSSGTGYGSDQSFTTSSSGATPTLATGSGSGSKGEKITLPITLTNIPGVDIAALSVDIEYDSMIFDNLKATIGPAGDSAGKSVETNEVSSGVFRISVFSTSNNTAIGDGVVAYLTLKIQAEAPTGSSTLTTTASGSDPSGVGVNISGLNGIVNIISDLAGDCDGDGLVSIAEVQSAINMFLGISPIEACVDVNENGKVSIGELQKVINNHLGLTGPEMVSFSTNVSPDSQGTFFDRSKLHVSANLPSLAIGHAIGEVGEMVTVPVTLNNVSGYNIAAISSDITYSSNVLENPTVEIGPAGMAAGKSVTFNEPSSGTLRIGILSLSNNNAIGNGVVAYLTFTIKAASGQTILGNSPEAADPSGNDVPITGINGTITSGEIIYVDPARQCGGNKPCFTSIQNAIDSAISCSWIRISEGEFDEDVMVDHAYGLILSGGWDSTFTIQKSETVINSLDIMETGGSVETDNIVLQ